MGNDIEQMVMMPGKENSHAEVMLYGGANPMVVVLSKEDCRDFGEMDGYVCDWENRRELIKRVVGWQKVKIYKKLLSPRIS